MVRVALARVSHHFRIYLLAALLFLLWIMSAAFVNDTLLAIGGYNGSHDCSTVEALDLKTLSWKSCANIHNYIT